MQFDLLPDLTGFAVAFALIALVGVALAVTEMSLFLAGNRKVRLARRESVVRYYGHLALGH